MTKEYIDKSALYEKIAQLEKLARNRYLETPSSSLCHSRYMTQLNERTALKRIIADFPSADVAPVQHGRWEFGRDLPDSFGSIIKNKYHLYCSECRNQAFNKTIDNDPDFDVDTPFCPWCGSKMVEEEVRENIKDAPTAAVVEVVRCCNCEFHDHDGTAGYCNYWRRWSNMSDFCSRGI